MTQTNTKFVLPTLWRLTSNGGAQAYESHVEGDKLMRMTWTKSAPKIDKNGQIVDNKRPIKSAKEPLYGESKNVGKSNQSTPHENAIVLAKSEWKKKIDRGYNEDEPILTPIPFAKKDANAPKQKKIPARALEELQTPMLLQKYGKNDRPLPSRACISVKRNGMCGFYRLKSNDIISRKDLIYPFFDHLKPALTRIAEIAEETLLAMGYEPRENDTTIIKAIHMELDLPDELNLTFQEKQSIIRTQKTPHNKSSDVIACIFDLGDQSIVPFAKRYAALVTGYEQWKKEAQDTTKIMLVRCHTIDSTPSMMRSLEIAELDNPKRGAEAFLTWVTTHYNARKEKWEPEPPTSTKDIEKWLTTEYELKREELVRLLHRWFVDGLGEEGSVIRDLDGLYQGNDYRSPAVLKYKDFEDEEAVVVGYETAKGAHSGAIVFLLRSLVTGAEYTCVFSEELGLSVDDRRELYKSYSDGSISIGQIVYTVRFQERYESGKPQFPTIVGECPPESKTIGGKTIKELSKLALEAHNDEVGNAKAKKPKKKP